jgi:glutamyl-tRNA reductase
MLPRLAEEIGAREVFYLATCNRVEVALAGDRETPLETYRPRLFTFLAGQPPEPGEAERTFRVWAGEGAAEHLFLVAAGFDSAKVGETEIAGQFREAFNLSRRAGVCGPRLEIILGEALKVAARIHSLAGGGAPRLSLAEIALDRARERLTATPGRVALVGVSPMTQRCARTLAEEGRKLVVVNRTVERARELAAEVGAEHRGLAEFREDPDAVEVVILATGASTAVLHRPSLERIAARAPSGQPPLIVDLAIPPDVAPEEAEAAGLPRFGMEEVIAEAGSSRTSHLLEMADARTLVDEALVGLRRRMANRMLGPVVAAIQRRYRDTARQGVERLFRRELSGLAEAEQEAVRRWADTLAHRFAHLPTEGLKGVALEAGVSGVLAFLERADEPLARELESLIDSGTVRPELEEPEA